MADVVTSENLAEFNRSRLRLPTTDAKPVEKPTEAVEKLGTTIVSRGGADDQEIENKEEKQDEPRKNGIAQRFSELTGARKEAERREQEALARATAAEAKLAESEKARKPADAEPQAADFKDAFEYAKALSAWSVRDALRKRDEKDFQDRVTSESTRVAKEWDIKARKAAKEIEDYADTIADADLKIPETLTMALLESDIGPRMQYFLAKNRDELDRLTAMSPVAMLRAFGRLEAKIEAEIEKPAGKKEEQTPAKRETEPVKIPAKRVQEAPEPITPIVGGSTGSQGVVDADGNVTGSYRDYKQARKAGKIR